MRQLLRTFLFGALAGGALSLARAPLGAELVSVPAVSAVDAALYRGLALIAIGLAVARARALSTPASYGALLFGALAGFAGHGLWFSSLIEVGGFGTLVLALALLAAAMLWAASGPPRTAERPAPNPLEMLGLGLGGAGAALALEAVARPLRLLGRGTPQDDTLFALTLLAGLAVGGAAFGPLLAGSSRLPGLALGLGLTALACLYSGHVLGEFSTRVGLDQYLRSPPWRLDTAYVGRLGGGALIGARVFLLPAFVLGAVLWSPRHRLQLASALVGAGLGLLVLNAFLIDPTPGTLPALGERCGERVALGALIAGAGGVLALLAARAHHPRVAVGLGLALALAVIGYARFGYRPHALPLSPWENFPVQPVWAADTPEGFMTVEPEPEGELLVTLDRRLLTPPGAAGQADRQHLATSWEVLPAERRAGCRVLLVGQLTPMRALTLKGLGAARVDRTAAWHASMAAIEEVLFGEWPRTPGEVLAPREAQRRLAAGGYELVLVPPTTPRGTRAPGPRPGGPPAVTWLHADGDLVHRDLGARVLLSSDGFDHLALGVHHGESGVAAGSPARGRSALAILGAWPFDRSRGFLREIGARLAAANRDGPPGHADLTEGLRLHLAAQTRSSPWETTAQSTELDDEALARLRAALLAVDPRSPESRFLQAFWNGAARTLVEKREPDRIQEYLTPLAEARSPWPELERALAHADFELLDPAGAARHLRAVIAAEPYDLSALAALAHALEMAGDPAAAAVELRRALAFQPDRRDLRRSLAVALVRAGDPEGSALVEQLLAEDPEDSELLPFRGPGPFPPPAVGFTPHSGAHDH